MIRICGGKYRHRKLEQPDINITRCTKDMVKEGLFSSLGFAINNSIFLDLFSGSGAIGIEAYSRGSKEVYLVDKSLNAINIIKKNLKTLGINDITLVMDDYLGALNYFMSSNIKFDIIFLDPPYNMNIDLKFLDVLKDHQVLNDKYIVIFEKDNKIDYQGINDYNVKELKYGKTYIYILRSII